jgi:hypothetical protein
MRIAAVCHPCRSIVRANISRVLDYEGRLHYQVAVACPTCGTYHRPPLHDEPLPDENSDGRLLAIPKPRWL